MGSLWQERREKEKKEEKEEEGAQKFQYGIARKGGENAEYSYRLYGNWCGCIVEREKRSGFIW
jgi:hypothetical protein